MELELGFYERKMVLNAFKAMGLEIKEGEIISLDVSVTRPSNGSYTIYETDGSATEYPIAVTTRMNFNLGRLK